jgi:hypothetical protein
MMISIPARCRIALLVLFVAQPAGRADAQIVFQTPFRPEASAGLFVGVRDFVDHEGRPRTGITPVKYAVDDAVDLAYLFAYDLKLIAPARTVLALSGEPQKAASKERLAQLRAAGADVRSANFTTLYGILGEQRNKVEPEGVLIISFATHGFGDAGGLLYAADTDPAMRQRTSISVTDLQETVNAARTPRRIVLLDACREIAGDANARAAGVSASRIFAEAMRNATGTAMVMATTAGGLSYDDDARQNGVFTASFIEALRSDVGIQDDGLATLGEVLEFTHARVRDWVLTHKPAAGGNPGISHSGDANALAIPLRADAATQQRIATERSRLFGVLQRDRDPAFVPDGVLQDVREKLSSLTVADARPLVLNLEVFASSAGRQSAAARSKAFLDWWQRQAPPSPPLAKAQDESLARPRPAPSPATPNRAADNSFANRFEGWFVCQEMYCYLTNVTRHADRIREIRLGEAADALDRKLDMKALAALPPLQAFPVPIRYGVGTMYAQLVFADGTLSPVRSISVSASSPTTSGIRLKALAAPPGVSAPAVFANYTAGTTNVTIMPDAPIGTDALLYSFDDGGFFETTNAQYVFGVTAPASTPTVRFKFRMKDGSEIGPFRYEVRNVEAAVARTTSSALAGMLTEAVVCTRIPFKWPPPADLNFEERRAQDRLAMSLMTGGVWFVSKAPAVVCNAHSFHGRQYWSTVKQMRFGSAPGRLGSTVVLAEFPKQHKQGAVPWHVELPADITGVYAQVVFQDGTTSREVRLPISELR